MVETAVLLVLLHRLTRPRLGLTGFVVAAAALGGLAHAPIRHWLPAVATADFAIMAYQYASFRDGLGPARAFWGVALSHAVNNGVAVLLQVAGRHWG